MRTLAGLLAAALLLGSPRTAPADDFSGAFDNLQSELADRQAALADATDPVQKKQLKAVVKSLKFLDKAADDLGDDLKTGGKVAKTLEKAFPDEFSPPVGLTAPSALSLRDHCEGAFGLLQSLVSDDLGDLDSVLATLSEKGKAKLQAGLDKAGAALESVDLSDFGGWAKFLAQAYKEAVKGQKLVEKDPGPTADYSISVDGNAFRPLKDTVVVVLDEVTGILVFSASKPGLPAFTLSVTPATAANSTGSKGVSVGSWIVTALPPKVYLAASGTFEITAIDLAANTITFNFSFTAPGQIGTPGSAAISGSYSGPYQGQ